MPLRYEDRVMVASSTTGTGTFTLGSAITGHRAFSDAIDDGDTVFYRAAEVDGDGIETGDFEIGYGTYDSGGTLTRTYVFISSGTLANPTVAAKGTVTSTASATHQTQAPTGVVAGSPLLLFAYKNNGGTNFSPPTGWTLLGTGNNAGNNYRLSIWTREADGTATDTPELTDVSAADCISVIYRIAGAKDYGYLNKDLVFTVDDTADTDTDIQAFTVDENDSLQIAAIINAGTATVTWPGSLTSETAFANGNDNLNIAIGDRNAGSVSAETITLSASGRKVLCSLVVRPGYPKVSFNADLRISVIATAAKLGRPDIQTFTSSGVWTKPLWATEAEVLCVGAGGGGGARGGSTANGSTAGAGGGAGGVITTTLLKTSTLNSLELVTVGAAGTGAVSPSSDANGTAGGATSFGSYAYAAGGTGSNGINGGTAVGTTGLYLQSSLAGGAGNSGAAGSSGANSTTVQAPGGAGGGGASGSAPFAGGSGGGIGGSAVTVNAIAGGAAGTTNGATGNNGGNGNSLEWLYGVPIGTGGGGGAGAWNAGAGATGGNGGVGGGYGAGGGGGGSATCTGGTAARGTGGNGAPGICVVVSY